MNTDCLTLGDVGILKREKVAFLSSRRVPPAAVMRSYDWAVKMREADGCVIGGFQSALERDVLKFLLKDGKIPVVMVLARKMWRIVPKEFRKPIEDGRLLVVSPVSQNVCRVSLESVDVRNRYILANCTSAVFASIDSGGLLDRLLTEFPNLSYCVLADVRER